MASSKSHEPSSSSSSSLRRRWRYDVFLSFRGEDTRTNFTDHLYIALKGSGINVFRDDNELRVGENISKELLEAIQDSRISVIVFSTDYAASSWCLEELAKIMECKITLQQLVYPIFYKVDPSVIRKQTHCFEKAFAKHQERFTVDNTSRWRNALTEAANLKGFHCKDSLEGEFVKKIVEEIRKHASIGYLDVAQYPVGLDSHVQKLDSRLHFHSNDVRIIGICAMGGMGKTTIAKAFYNHLLHGFEYKGFLDVRESSKNGYLHLQNKFLSEILKSNTVGSIPEGITEIRHRLMCTRVLLVLDDVDCSEQLRDLAIMREHGWFASGSTIIITTRDEHLLTSIKVDCLYMVEELNDDESLELFSWHAFSTSHPEKDYVGLSKEIIYYCKGLPLALTVLGSLLFERGASFWKDTLKMLKSIPDEGIQKKLKISYDALNCTQQAIFLDVACFFIGVDKDYAHAILDGCGFFPENGITTLISRCLLTINEYNKLMMHDLLRDMGREIVREECPKEPGKRSRLWKHDDALDVLKNHKGTEAVEGFILKLSMQNEEHLSTEAFANMRNLRLLQLNYVNLIGSYDNFSKDLRWICWHGFPLNLIPENFHLENLVVLDMRYSNLRQFSKEMKVLKKLKVLNLSHSYYLTKTPNFSKTPNLEDLELKDCTSLVKVHPSIGNLHRLVLLDMRDCKQLKSLPNSICKLKALKILNLCGCSKFERLPNDMRDMEALVELLADQTAIRQVPPLKNIEKLSLCGLTGRSFDSVFWSLVSPRKSLNSVNLMPSSLLGLTSLVSLNLGYCNLSDDVIAKDFGCLYSLQYLDLSGNNFCSLPAGISTLPELSELHVNECTSLQSLPDLPRKFETLNARFCTSLERFPNVSRVIGRPHRIVDLRLTGCPKLASNPGWKDSINDLNMYTSKNNLVASAVMDALPHFNILLSLTGFGSSLVSFILNPRYVTVEIYEYFPGYFRHQSISHLLCLPVLRDFEDAVLDVCILYNYSDLNNWGTLWLRRYGGLVLRSGDQLELLIRQKEDYRRVKMWGVYLNDKYKGGTIQSNGVYEILHDICSYAGGQFGVGYGDDPFGIDLNIKPT